MKSDKKFIVRLYLTFGIFILVSLALLVNADILSSTWIVGFVFAVIPVLILLQVFEYIYSILAVLSSVDIMEYEISHRFILRFFGLLPVFKLLKSSIHVSML